MVIPFLSLLSLRHHIPPLPNNNHIPPHISLNWENPKCFILHITSYTTSWWFQPLWKIWSSNWESSPGRGEILRKIETTNQIHHYCQPTNQPINQPINLRLMPPHLIITRHHGGSRTTSHANTIGRTTNLHHQLTSLPRICKWRKNEAGGVVWCEKPRFFVEIWVRFFLVGNKTKVKIVFFELQQVTFTLI